MHRQTRGFKDLLFWSAHLCHELVGDGLQELGHVVLGANEVGWTRGSRLCRGEKTGENKNVVNEECKTVQSNHH